MKKVTKITRVLSFLLSSFLPSLALAQFSLENTDFRGVVFEVISVIRMALPLLIGVAFIIFFWGVTKFILNSGNAAEIQKGRNYILWGIIALFLLTSIMGIISFFASELEGFGFDNESVTGALLN